MPIRSASQLGLTTAFLLLSATACSSPQTDTPEQQASEPPATTTSLTPEAPTPSSNTAPQPDSQPQSYDVQPITPTELTQVAKELGASEEVFSEHSFSLKLPDSGDVAFIASRSDRPNQPFGDLVMRLRYPDGKYQPLVPANQMQGSAWNFWDLKAISFDDFNGDGLGPDIIAIAEYMTGAGPEAAQPFPVVTVQFREPGGFFTANAEIDQQLSDQGISTISEVRAALSQ